MGYSVFPAPSASSKTRYVVNLLSGTTYTVPAGVTYINATLIGGGGSGATEDGISDGATGTFGQGGQIVTTNLATTPGGTITYAIGAGGTGGAGSGGSAGGDTTMTGCTTGTGGRGGASPNGGTPAAGSNGRGAGNGGGNAPTSRGAGGSGMIEIEYWAQEITMRTFAVIEDNKVINIIVGVEPEVVAANPGKYIDYTDGWDYNNGIDGGVYFPVPTPEVTE